MHGERGEATQQGSSNTAGTQQHSREATQQVAVRRRKPHEMASAVAAAPHAPPPACRPLTARSHAIWLRRTATPRAPPPPCPAVDEKPWSHRYSEENQAYREECDYWCACCILALLHSPPALWRPVVPHRSCYAAFLLRLAMRHSCCTFAAVAAPQPVGASRVPPPPLPSHPSPAGGTCLRAAWRPKHCRAAG